MRKDFFTTLQQFLKLVHEQYSTVYFAKFSFYYSKVSVIRHKRVASLGKAKSYFFETRRFC